MTTERVIAERVLTGEILSWNVPLTDASAVRELSAPGGIFGKIAPKDANLIGDDGLPLLREWSTAIYHEVDGKIRAAGLVVRLVEEPDDSLRVEAPGFSVYPYGIVHADTYTAPLGADALDGYRHFWNYVQGFKNSDLGVTVDATDSGTSLDEEVEKQVQDNDPDTPPETKLVPYRVPWWEYRDCGRVMDELLELAPADYVEEHGWNADHTAFTHHINLGSPRLGKKRSDLRFVEGENVIEAVPFHVEGDEFAQVVYAAGRGEGRKMRHSSIHHIDDRLRRTALVVDKEAGQNKVDRLARREYQRRNDTKGFKEVWVRDHRNARIHNIHPGDDILVEAPLQWYGRVRKWVRVLSIEQALGGDDIALLRVDRSDRFRY